MSVPATSNEYISLYELTGRITDINTVLINRKDLEVLHGLLELQLKKETK